MAEEIKITLGADSSKLTAELIAAQNELKKFNQALAKATDVKEIEALQANILKLQQRITGLSTQMPKLANNSNTATQSLTNLSRIAQDAPYGFIGIANNINPLLESFQRLQVETGSSKNAFKALLSSLAGPAGLGLAVGIASSLLVTFGDKLFSTGKAADEAAKENEKFAESLKQAEQGALASANKLQAYVNIAKDSNLPLAQRNEALKEANKIMGEHGEKLTLVNVGTEATTRAIQLFTQATVAQAVATKYSDKLADLIIKKNEILQRQTTQQTQAEIAKTQAVTEADKAQTRRFGTSETAALKAYSAATKNNDAQKQLITTGNELTAITKEIANINNLLTQTTLDATSAFGELGTKPKETKKKVKKDVDELAEFLKKFNSDIIGLIKLETVVGIGDKEIVKKQFKTLEDALEKLIVDFNIKPTDPLIVRIKAGLQDLPKEVKPIKRDLEKELGNQPIDIKILPKLEDKTIDPKSFKNLVYFTEGVNNFIQTSFADISILLGETIGNALNGTATFGDFFEGIFKIIGGGLQELGKYFVTTAGLIKLIKEQLILSPQNAIIAGIALIALGSVISSQLGKKQAFAVGTRNAPGGVALVGERGPELINLPRGSQVVPAAQTASMMGGIAGAVEVFGVLRGQDIYFSNKKYGQTYGRTT